MKITLTGDLYSGKTCLAKKLCKHYKLSFFSAGLILRKNAEELGMSIVEYNAYMDNNDIDKVVDENTKQIGLKEEDFVFDARLAWFFIKDSIKIYLRIDPCKGAIRAMKDSREAEKYSSLEEAKETIIKRSEIERERFQRLYGADIQNIENYDLVLDTSELTQDQVYNIAVEFIESRLEIHK